MLKPAVLRKRVPPSEEPIDDPTRESARSSMPRGATPVTMRWVLGIWASLLLGATLLWPVDYGYDEITHFDMAYAYAQHPFTFYAPGDLHLSAGSVGIQTALPANPSQANFDTAQIPPRGQRPTVQELGGHTQSSEGPANQMVQHPPLYYWLGAAILDTPGVSHLAWDQQMWLLRLLSVLLMLPVPWLCWATAKRFAVAADRHGRLTENQLSAIGLAAAIVPLTIPNLIRVGASVTNDSLLISASSFFLYFLIRIATGDLSRRTVTGAAVFCAAALLTKGFALILPPILIAALFMGIRRRRRDGLPVTGLPVIAAITTGAIVVGSLWWLRNIAVYGHVQTNGFGPGANDLHYGPADHSGQLYKFIPNFLVQFFQRTWGGFALPDAPAASPLAIWGWITVIAIGLLAALGAALRQLRSVTVLLLATVALTVAVVASGAWSVYQVYSHVGVQGAQGRYLYHLVVILAALASLGWYSLLRPRPAALLPAAALTMAVITNASAWILIINTWYSGAQKGFFSKITVGLHGVLRWAPFPAPVTFVMVGAVAPVVVVGWTVLWRWCRATAPAELALSG